MLEAIDRYLALLARPPTDAEADLASLVVTLDDLVSAVSALPPGNVIDEDATYPGSPVDFASQAKAAFPSLGYYSSSDPLKLENVAAFVCDPIDDLSDIAKDLSEGKWEWLHSGPEQGAWTLRLLYQAHWGDHLHRLRYYLHCEMYK